MYIAIAGITGAGKSEATIAVANQLKCNAYLEVVDEIPEYLAWLADKGSLYKAQLAFLNRAFRLQKDANANGGIQERTIYENYEVSIRYYYDKKMLSSSELLELTSAYNKMCKEVAGPDVLFHLTATVERIVERTAKRDRDDDRLVKPAEIKILQIYYEKMLKSWTLSPIINIDTTNIDIQEVASLIVKKVSEDK